MLQKVIVFLVLVISTWSLQAQTPDFDKKQQIELLTKLLDDWYSGELTSYPTIYVDSCTYFDPMTKGKRLDGRDELVSHTANFGEVKAEWSGIQSAEFTPLKDAMLLTYTLDQKAFGIKDTWNATEVYIPVDSGWKVVHGHWSPYSDDLWLFPYWLVYGGGSIILLLGIVGGYLLGRRRRVK